MGPSDAAVELIAVVVTVTDGQPRVLTIHGGQALPSGAFEVAHRSLQQGVRAWVEQQTHHPLGYVEQLYTFADRDRGPGNNARRTISIAYLGLTREVQTTSDQGSYWRNWYDYFPWEDRRSARSRSLLHDIAGRLQKWVATAPDPGERRSRRQRVAITFGLHEHAWNEELVLQRYELLYEAGLIEETLRADVDVSGSVRRPPAPLPGQAMALDHRRILATAAARLRAKIKYRPVVFELMPGSFTLLQLQRTVEGVAGRAVHKQNFRRLVEGQQLVEETGATAADTRGRPARLFRFRHAVLVERAVIGTRLPLIRT